MLMIISPAKTLDYKNAPPMAVHSEPAYLDQAQQLIEILKRYSPQDIAKLMHISDALAVLNVGRFAQWQRLATDKNSKQAIFAFMGEVYVSLDAYHLPLEALHHAQQHLCILSGLYGILRPLDLIQAYRLEMGTKLTNPYGKNLYDFWGEMISQGLNRLLEKSGSHELVNLASDEYFKAIKRQCIVGNMIQPVFEDFKNGRYKTISFYAKRARGLMTRFALLHHIKQAEALKNFDSEGYEFVPTLSDESTWIFHRHQ